MSLLEEINRVLEEAGSGEKKKVMDRFFEELFSSTNVKEKFSYDIDGYTTRADIGYNGHDLTLSLGYTRNGYNLLVERGADDDVDEDLVSIEGVASSSDSTEEIIKDLMEATKKALDKAVRKIG